MRQAAAHLRNWAKTDIFTAFIVCNKDEKANLRMGPAVARFHAGLCPKRPVGRYGACACGGPVRGGNRRRPLFRGRPAEFRQEQPGRRLLCRGAVQRAAPSAGCRRAGRGYDFPPRVGPCRAAEVQELERDGCGGLQLPAPAEHLVLRGRRRGLCLSG